MVKRNSQGPMGFMDIKHMGHGLSLAGDNALTHQV
jgi:hypothetical protein